MRKLNLLFLFLACIMVSCNSPKPTSPYVYNTNPQYTWGYVEYYGAYYAQYGNKNTTLSVSLFSDSLSINSESALEGTGQYLFLEDVFLPSTDVFLPVGTYTINNTGNAFTIFAGENDTIDSQIYPIGAYISYYEANTSKSTLKLIANGSFTVVSHVDSIYNISCDFKTSDSIKIKGSFRGILPHYNQSVTPTRTVSPARRRTMTTLL